MLWPETRDERANGNLRSALWRLNQLGCDLVVARGSTLQLNPYVRVDLHENSARARQFLRDESDLNELDESLFYSDLLPDRYEDWLMIERDRFHELRLRALESICERLTAKGAYARAIEAAFAAVAADPLRESAQRALVKVHLAEGNVAGAIRQFQLYVNILRAELGVAPSRQFTELVSF
jgi:DNA-binding SARP family transcriptional activator